MNKRIVGFSIMIIVLLGFAFQNSWDRYPIAAKEYIEKRLADFQAKKWNECRRNANEEAKRLVDQFLIEKGGSFGRDTFSLRPKPVKPSMPEFNAIRDTSPIRPILPDSMKNRKMLKNG